MAIALALLAPLFTLWIYETSILHPSDFEKYTQLIENRKVASSNAFSPTNQERKQVRKDIWFSQDESTRLHYQIASEGSQLTLTPVKNKFELVEKLEGIKCWMQDKLISNAMEENAFSQQARFIEAEAGIYRHTTQEFSASGVTLSLFRLCGHDLPTQPLNENEAVLRGIARDISFHFSGKTPHFQASQFEATMVKE